MTELEAKITQILDRLPAEQLKPWMAQIICSIILLRRRESVNASWAEFNRLFKEHVDELDQLGYRWINSVVDTFVDYGYGEQRSQYLLISSFFVQVRLLQLQRSLHNSQLRPDFWPFPDQHPDKFGNFLQRMDKAITLPYPSKVWKMIRNGIEDGVFEEINELVDIFPGFVDLSGP